MGNYDRLLDKALEILQKATDGADALRSISILLYSLDARRDGTPCPECGLTECAEDCPAWVLVKGVVTDA